MLISNYLYAIIQKTIKERFSTMQSKLLTKEKGLYLLFGILTTLLDWFIFWLIRQIWGQNVTQIANVTSFIIATTFAFFTNKYIVFQHTKKATSAFWKELMMFFSARLFTLGITSIILWLSQNVLHAEQFHIFIFDGIMMTKIATSGVALVLNYIFSKYLIFKKSRT